MKLLDCMILSPLETLLAFAGALALFLAPIDAVKHFSEIPGILFTLVVCISIYLLLLFVFKNNRIIAPTMLLSMVFYAIKYIALCINSSYYNHIQGNILTLGITFFDVVSYGLILFIPCVISISIHLVHLKTTFQAPNKINEFILFFKVATISFYIFYVIVLTGKVIFNVPIGNIENPNFNLVPFANLNSQMIFTHFVVGILLFVPLGFTFSIYLKWINIFTKLMLTIIFGSIIALTMYLLGTYNIDTGFLIFAILGYLIGLLIKILIDKIYSIWLGIPNTKVIYTNNQTK